MRRRRKRPGRIAVPVASMGDIAFLLIIFFVLTTNFIKEKDIELEQPESPDIEQMEETQVSVSVDENGEVWLQGDPIHVETLESEVAALVENKEDKAVMLKVDKNLKHSAYGPVVMALSEAGVEIALVGEKIKE